MSKIVSLASSKANSTFSRFNKCLRIYLYTFSKASLLLYIVLGPLTLILFIKALAAFLRHLRIILIMQKNYIIKLIAPYSIKYIIISLKGSKRPLDLN